MGGSSVRFERGKKKNDEDEEEEDLLYDSRMGREEKKMRWW